MASEESKPQYLKLNRDNYFVWNKLTRAQLAEKDLWEAVEPGYTDEDLGANGDAAKTKNLKALSQLYQSVEHYYLDDIGKLATAKEAWEDLKRMNTDFSTQHTIYHLRDLVATKKKEDECMREYLSKISSLARKCALGGLAFSDTAISYFMLLGLPSNYEEVVRKLEMQGDDLATADVKAKLLLEEKMQGLTRQQPRRFKEEVKEKDDRQEVDEARALAVTRQFKDYQGRSNSYNQGYRPSQPKQNQSWRGPPPGGDSSVRDYNCYTCGAMGHIARVCPSANKESPKQPSARFASAGGVQQSAGEPASAVSAVNDDKVVALCVKSDAGEEGEWFVDSCASDHFCYDASKFVSISECVSGSVSVGDGTKQQIRVAGTVKNELKEEFGGKVLMLSNVFYVPDLDTNLISVGKLANKGVITTLGEVGTGALKGETIFTAKKRGDVYYVGTVTKSVQDSVPPSFQGVSLITQVASESGKVEATCKKVINNGMMWHRRLGHLNYQDLKRIPHLKDVKCEEEICTTCVKAKSARKGFKGVNEHRAEKLLELTHSDVMGKFSTPSVGGGLYALTLLDDNSRYATVKILKSKDEVPKHVKQYKALNENKLGER